MISSPVKSRLAMLSGALIGLATTAAAQAQQSNPNSEIEEVVVVGRAQEFYRVNDSSFATKTPTDIMDIPQSVQVLTRQLIDDQAARDTRDLYRSISGVSFFSYSGVTFRGFRQDEVRYDGVRGDPFAGFSVPQLFNFERVEVLKGVAGMLYGAGEPGGLINYVTKRPEYSQSGAINVTGGNRGLAGLSAEITGPLAGDSMAYRASAFIEEEDDFRNNARSETEAITGALSFRPGDATEIITQLSYYDINLPGNRLRGVPVDDDGNFLTDISWNTNEKTDFLALEALIGQVIVQHEFSDNLRSNIVLRYVDNDEQQQYHESRDAVAPGSTLYRREFRDQQRSNDQISLTADFVVTQEWGNTEHTWLFGADTFKGESEFQARTAPRTQVPELDLINPVYGNSGFDILLPILETIPYRRTDTETTRNGLYVQDQIKLNEQWQVVAGLRYDDYQDQDSISNTSADDTDISLRAAVVYSPTDGVSLFANFSEGFVPIGIVDPLQGGPYDPEEGDQFELGVKTELFDGRILAGVTAYQIVKEGVLVSNPADGAGVDGSGIPGSLQIGEATAKGVEFDVVGDITDNWTFQANYAYNDTRITGGPPDGFDFASDDRFPNAPRNAAGIWTRYEIVGLNSALAGGLEYVGKRVSLSQQDVQAYTTVDLSWISEIDAWTLQFNVRNLFDEEYAASGFISRTGHFPGEPRTYVTQVSYEF